MIDTVTFDVWNTLLIHEFDDDRVKNARIQCIASALKNKGLSVSVEDILKAYDYTESYLSELWGQEKDLDLDGHIALLFNGLELKYDDGLVDAIKRPYSRALLRFPPSIVDGTASLLSRLKGKGYRIGLISNTGRTPGVTMRAILERYGLSGYFDSMTFSNEVGYIKPNRKIFEASLKDLGAEPQGVVHIGDNMLLDIYGAKSSGMKAILFSGYSERFDNYAQKYYHANGRYEKPDMIVDSLGDVEDALNRLGGI